MKAYNTFAVDVKCKYFVESDKGEDFAEFAKAYDLSRENVLVLGGGSNLLFTEDFDGVVLYPSMRGFRVEEEDDESVRVSVGSGEVWDDFVAWAVEHGYGGVENLSLCGMKTKNGDASMPRSLERNMNLNFPKCWLVRM